MDFSIRSSSNGKDNVRKRYDWMNEEKELSYTRSTHFSVHFFDVVCQMALIAIEPAIKAPFV